MGFLQSCIPFEHDPSVENSHVGFCIATVPEPSAYALLLMTAASALWMTRRRRQSNRLTGRNQREISGIGDCFGL